MSLAGKITNRASGAFLGSVDGQLDEQKHLVHAVKNELWGRMEKLSTEISTLHDSIRDYSSLQRSSIETQGAALDARLAQVEQGVAETSQRLGHVEHNMSALTEEAWSRMDGAKLNQVDGNMSRFLNYAASHRGPLAEADLWINHPLSLEWDAGSVRVANINERILEHPFVLGAAAALTPGSRILDIGGAESTIGLSLASLGYRVTVIEPQGYPFAHPNLEVAEVPLEDFKSEHKFDAVILLSTIEHFGIGHYANNPERDERADLDAMAIVAALLVEGGKLILTTPFGPAEVNDVERIYDQERLRNLIQGFDIEQTVIGVKADDGNWIAESNELGDPAGPNRVAMVLARLAPTS